MGVFETFPYTNFHEMNLDWLLKAMKEVQQELADFKIEVSKDIVPLVKAWIESALAEATYDPDEDKLILVDGTGIVMDDDPINFIQILNEIYPIQDAEARTILSNLTDRIDNLEDHMPDVLLNTYRTTQFYISANGSDDNDGRSRAQAFQTLDRAFREWNKYDALWLYIVTPGRYEARDIGIYTKTMHIYAEVDNVVIDFIDPDSGSGGIPVYNCHWVFQSRWSKTTQVTSYLRIQCHESDGVTDGHLYFDNCMVNMTRVIFDQYVSTNGGSANFSDCTFNRLRSHTSFLLLRVEPAPDPTSGIPDYEHANRFTNTVPGSYCLDLDFSMTHVTGNVRTANLTAAGTSEGACVHMTGGYAFFGSLMMSNNTNNYYYWFKGNQGASLHISTARVTQLDNWCTGGHYLETGASLDTY